MLGIIAGLGAAFSWTCACFLWHEQAKKIAAIKLNFIKNLIAVIIFSPILFSFNWLAHLQEILILFGSGILGISIGDSLYINALKRIGTRRTLSIEALSPILANILGVLLINENLPIKAWIGTFIVSVSLIGIIKEKRNGPNNEVMSDENYGFGIAFALLSVSFAVLAAVLSRIVLTSSNFSPFQTTEIRLLGALLFLFPIARTNLNYIFQEMSIKTRFKIFGATLLGTNIGILLQQTVFLLLPIGLGWTLLSISPVISLFFSKAEGEQITWKSIILAMTTFAGVAIALI